jgi:hypothetical protein
MKTAAADHNQAEQVATAAKLSPGQIAMRDACHRDMMRVIQMTLDETPEDCPLSTRHVLAILGDSVSDVEGFGIDPKETPEPDPTYAALIAERDALRLALRERDKQWQAYIKEVFMFIDNDQESKAMRLCRALGADLLKYRHDVDAFLAAAGGGK